MYMANLASKGKISYVVQETPDYENNWQDEPGLPVFSTFKEAQYALNQELSNHPKHSFHFSHRILERCQ